MNLSDRRRVMIGRVIVVLAAAMAVLSLILYVASGETERLIDDWALHNITAALLVGGVAYLALLSVPRNGAVWALAWAAFFSSLQAAGAATGLAVSGISNGDIQAGLVTEAPADLEYIGALGLNIALWAWVPALFTLLTFGLLLFPNGNVPTGAWRWVGWAAVVAMGLLAIPWAWTFRPSSTTSYAVVAGEVDSISGPAFALLMGSVVASIAALVVHWRRSGPEERLQFRWVGWGLGVFALVTVAVLPFSSDVYQVVSLALIPVLAVSYGVAITKYRLYEIDVVVSRTFVYGALAVFITVTYIVIVAGLGALIGGGDDPSPALAVGATALIALAFQPLRRWLERVANRLVYGRRATPYEVLSAFSQRVAATDEGLVDLAAESLVGGTGAESGAVWVTDGDSWVRTAVYPPETRPSQRPALDAHGDAGSVVARVQHDGEALGAVALHAPTGQRLSDEDRRLAGEVASAMGLALRNQRLTEMLQGRVDELRESRRRIVAVQDETRRTLERDLHDGAQQQLVALKVKLGLARQLATKDGADRTAALLEQLSTETDEAVEAMRDFARGIYPPLLEAEGLGPALAAQARRAPLPVTIDADGLGRFGRDTEATVYFCVLEALQNVAKYAQASTADVALGQHNGSVTFAVTDNGVGFDPDRSESGVGITNMRDRVLAMGGWLEVHSTPGGGTRIAGCLPAYLESN